MEVKEDLEENKELNKEYINQIIEIKWIQKLKMYTELSE